jgi:hypothetical protein
MILMDTDWNIWPLLNGSLYQVAQKWRAGIFAGAS